MKLQFVIIAIIAVICIACAEKKQTKLDGAAIFRKNCVLCHGIDGKLGTNGAKDLTKTSFTLAERKYLITNGKNVMTPFKGVLTVEEIDAVARYTLKLQQ